VRRLLGALATGALLAACGSHSGSASRTAAPVSTTTTTVTTTATSTTSAPATAAETNATGTGCSAHQIALSVASAGAATGHVGLILRFRNTSGSVCVLTGYPGVAFSTVAGQQVQAKRTLTGFMGGLSPTQHAVPVLRLPPKATASAVLEGLDSDLTHGGGPCPRYAHLLVTAPNQRVTIRMTTPLAQICAPEVHPVVAGATGRAPG
jgi:Protein of unknown function (DUF4232)